MATWPPADETPAMVPAFRRVVARRRETRDTWTMELEAAEGAAFQPGQFNMLYAFGKGEVPVSLSGDAARPERLTHTIRSVGLATAGLCALAPGDLVGVRGPFGRGWPLAEARGGDVVVVGGGLGLAPVRPAVYAILGDRDAYGAVAFLAGARTPGDLLYGSELHRWRGRFDVQVEVTVDAAPPEWHGEVGVVTRLIDRAAVDPARTTALVCGPEVMMWFTIQALRRRGLRPESIWLSLERNMQCAVGLCGHCQLGPHLVCRDGPVLRLDQLEPYLLVRDL